jgi:hypothetical protein
MKSIAPASGAEFSVLPAQNTSGNWVKVVQRFPYALQSSERSTAALGHEHLRHRRYRASAVAIRSAVNGHGHRFHVNRDRPLVVAYHGHRLCHGGHPHAGVGQHHRQCGASLYAGFASATADQIRPPVRRGSSSIGQGFAVPSLGLASLQLMLDRGEQQDWSLHGDHRRARGGLPRHLSLHRPPVYVQQSRAFSGT